MSKVRRRDSASNRGKVVLVSGAAGFVGQAVLRRLAEDGRAVRATTRTAARLLPDGVERVDGLDLAASTDWREALEGVDTVVHAAGRVHVMHETATDPMEAFRAVNVGGTMALARQAAAAGVRRFVFISSIGVNGAQTYGSPFTEADAPAPHSPYAQSKLEAELALRALSRETGLEVVIIRPPLVFGPDAPGNFERLMRALCRGTPLPLGAVHNRRSLVALGNLTDLIATTIDHPAAANQLFLVSDDEDLSTTELLRRTAKALGRSACLLPVPATLIQGALALLGRKELAQRLLGSLQVDISHTRQVLSWAPPVRVDDALAEAAQAFLDKEPKS